MGGLLLDSLRALIYNELVSSISPGVPMDWELRNVPAALRARYAADGHWTDDTFAAFIERAVGAAPALPFRVWSDTHPFSGTIGGLYEQSLRMATGLARRGVGVGDVVAYQLPNWAEAVSIIWAGFRIGAVMVPIVHFYGAGEVEFILQQSGAKLLVTVDRFGHVDHAENLRGIRDRLTALEHVVVVPSGTPGPSLPGAVGLDALLSALPFTGKPDIDPDRPAMVGYTSGTTANPKGVIHTHRSLLFETRQLASLDMGAGRPPFVASPLAHMTGLLAANLMPVYRHDPIHLTDRWDPGRALEIMVEAGIGLGGGATIFLTSLLDHPSFGPRHIELIQSVGLGGSPVPAAVAERAEALGIKVTRAYGSTEHPSITGATPAEPQAKRNRTDGHVLEGVEIRIVDEEGRDLRAGQAGEIWSRGPDLFAGYTDPALTARVVTGDGWYHTGDVGVLDEDGYLTITDRLSDVIIRGGLNLSAAEIEEALMRMPAVAECAVVAAPHERFGERACGVLRIRPGAEPPDLAAVQAHLGAVGLPKQKWIEELRIVRDFPRTPSGKIRKFVIRSELRKAT
jgi:acyl-CoA synthetase (AMP-forming)/AMP-acid ligase II